MIEAKKNEYMTMRDISIINNTVDLKILTIFPSLSEILDMSKTIYQLVK